MIRFNRQRLRDLAEVLRAAGSRSDDAQRSHRAGPVPTGMVPLTIATWNIHSCVGGDARFSPDRIAAVIRDMKPDIVGMQEVGWHHRGETGHDQFAHLASATGMDIHAAPTKHNAHAHYGNALLSRLPVKAFHPIDLSQRFREPRGGLDAIFEVAGRPVRIIVAHLGLDPWERAEQIERIIAMTATDPDLPTIFMGDLNEWMGDSPRLRRLDQAFDDWVAPRSFNARLPAFRLDRVFVRGGLRLVAADTVRTRLTRHASDHLPVRVVIAVP